MGIDGTVLDAPDTPANSERFGRSSGGPLHDQRFPILRVHRLEPNGAVEGAVAGAHEAPKTLVSVEELAVLIELEEADRRGRRKRPEAFFVSVDTTFHRR